MGDLKEKRNILLLLPLPTQARKGHILSRSLSLLSLHYSLLAASCKVPHQGNCEIQRIASAVSQQHEKRERNLAV